MAKTVSSAPAGFGAASAAAPGFVRVAAAAGPLAPRKRGRRAIEALMISNGTRGPCIIQPFTRGMVARSHFVCGVAVMAFISGAVPAAQVSDRRQLERSEQTLRQEGQAVVALADAPADSPAPADFLLTWRNDFFKAQTGTFVAFAVTIAPRAAGASAALLYVRAARPVRAPADSRRPAAGEGPVLHPFEEIYPVVLSDQPVRIARGFSLPPGEYQVTVVVREREREDDRKRRRLAAVLRQPMTVPDYGTGELATSTIMLAADLQVLREPPPASALFERPYVIGTREIEPASDSVFRPSEELIVVFLIYNPLVTSDKQFDLEVEYHFFRRNGAGARDPLPGAPPGLAALPGERYFNRTEPQRFNPVILGPPFDPGSGQPVMAGQGVPLAGFPEGDYRLLIRVTDRIARRSLEREVTFTVRS